MSDEQTNEPNDLATLVRADEQRRLAAFKADLEAAMAKHKCSLVVEAHVLGEKSSSAVRVVADKV